MSGLPADATLDAVEADTLLLDSSADISSNADRGDRSSFDRVAPVLEEAGSDADASSGDAADDPIDEYSDAEGGPDGLDGDAGIDGPDSASETTYALVQSTLGTACANCGADPDGAACFGGAIDCESLPDRLEGATDSGLSQPVICFATLACSLATRCMIVEAGAPDPGDGLACYCGDIPFVTCETTSRQGACRSNEQVGFGSVDPDVIFASYFDVTVGAGMANTIALCLLQSCQSDCFP